MTEYHYDGDGNRVRKVQNGIQTRYVNDVALPLVEVLMEMDGVENTQAVYTYGNDLISVNRSGVNTYYHYDGLGSVRQLTDAFGQRMVSYMYDGFGNVRAVSGTADNPYGFTGESQFPEADNLIYLRARYYTPALSRFLSRDTMGYEDGINLYVYVQNNPVNRVDPEGLWGWPFWKPGKRYPIKEPEQGASYNAVMNCATDCAVKVHSTGAPVSRTKAIDDCVKCCASVNEAAKTMWVAVGDKYKLIDLASGLPEHCFDRSGVGEMCGKALAAVYLGKRGWRGFWPW